MTIRDIAVAFGIEVDQKSVGAAENAIKGVKNMASKLLGAIGIGFFNCWHCKLSGSSGRCRGIKITVFAGIWRFRAGCFRQA